MTKHRYKAEIQSWLKKSNDDLELARDIVLKKKHAWAACFHCHQVAEKALKALLLFLTNSYPKEHDLIELANLINGTGTNKKSINDDLLVLDRYYVSTRYPTEGSYELTQKHAKEAIAMAGRVLKFVKTNIS